MIEPEFAVDEALRDSSQLHMSTSLPRIAMSSQTARDLDAQQARMRMFALPGIANDDIAEEKLRSIDNQPQYQMTAQGGVLVNYPKLVFRDRDAFERDVPPPPKPFLLPEIARENMAARATLYPPIMRTLQAKD